MNDIDSDGLFKLFQFVANLKEEARDGWNNRALRRRVQDAESVAEHSMGAVILGMVIPLVIVRLQLNRERLMVILAVHDLEEILTRDINIYTAMTDLERNQIKAAKKRKTKAAMRKIRMALGSHLGEFVCAAHKEYEDGQTPESRIAKEIDKLEVALQAWHYYQRGHKIDPREFYTNSMEKLATIELIKFMEKQLKPRLPTEAQVKARFKTAKVMKSHAAKQKRSR